MNFENERQRELAEERQKNLREQNARRKLVNHLRKSGLGLVEINKLLVDCGYRKGK